MNSTIDTDVAQPALHAREEEVRWLTAALGTARRGAGVVLVVEGAAGTGKSRLVQEARSLARARDAVVLCTRALEPDRGPAVYDRLCEAARRAGGAPADDLVGAVAQLAASRPVLLAVDDVERCDPVSLQALAALALQVDDIGGLALLLTRRHHAPGCGGLVDSLFGDPGAIRIRLRALEPDAVAALLADVLEREPSDAVVAAVVALTGGNPFLVGELALAAREHGCDPTSDLPLPSVARAVRGRADGADELLDAIAVLGDDASAATLAAMTGCDVTDTLAALVAADVLAACDPPRFAQPLLRHVVLAALAPRDRSRLHAAAARVLAGTAGEAAHLLAASPGGDAWTAAHLRDAAADARAAGDTAAAVAYLRRALAEGVPELEGELARALGEVAAMRGERDAARQFERALAIGGEPEVALALVRVHLASGDEEAARRVGEAALRNLGAAADRHLSAATDGGFRAGAERNLGRAAGDDSLRVRLEAELMPARACERLPDGPGARLLLAQRAAAAARDGEDREHVAHLARRALQGGALFDEEGSLVPYHAVEALAAADCHDEAAALYDFALVRAEARGSTFAAAAVRARRARARLRLGDVHGAIDDARAALAAAPFGGCAVVCGPAVDALAAALIELDDLDGALAAVENAGPPLARARVYLAQGRFAAALCEAEAAGADTPWRSLAALCYLGRGDPARAHALASEDLELARRAGAPAPTARALRVLARTDEAHAVAHCRAAVEQLAGSSAQLDRAHALVDLGMALRTRGRKREAREVLRDAMQLAHQCGTTRLVKRARDELVAAGGRPRRPAHQGIDGLTRSERRVAELAAAGLSNREIGGELFVTINTVGAHLASVYRKLGISSRAQLPLILAPGATS